MSRPTIAVGAYGSTVAELQRCLQVTPDRDFGPATRKAVETYQAQKSLSVDGVVGQNTWAALTADFSLPAYPPPLPALMPPVFVDRIKAAALASPVASYNWKDRGKAPSGFTAGMAVAWAQTYQRFVNEDPIAWEMAKADTKDDVEDAISWYRSNFASAGMTNNDTSSLTLRHLFVMLMGLGMRESSGKFCCGRDQSASNTNSNTCEAGLFQTSWNANVCCTDFIVLFDQYQSDSPQGYKKIFEQNVTCSESNWKCYGSGDGYRFQKLCKDSPAFAVETCAIGLRNLRKHWGPINRKEVEIRIEADAMFAEVQDLVERGRGEV